MKKPAVKPKIPDWQLKGLGETQWKALDAWLIGFAVSLVITFGVQAAGVANPPWFTLSLIPFLIVFNFLGTAYRRGVRDAEERARNTQDAATPTV